MAASAADPAATAAYNIALNTLAGQLGDGEVEKLFGALKMKRGGGRSPLTLAEAEADYKWRNGQTVEEFRRRKVEFERRRRAEDAEARRRTYAANLV